MENFDIAKYFFALVLVLGLMGGLWLLLKKAGNGFTPFFKNATKRRLSVIEVLPLDAKRKAMILRCDNSDHLIILGQTGETVVGHKITKPDATDENFSIEEI